MKSKGLLEDNVSDGGGSSDSQFFKTYKETKEWLDEMRVKKYEINKETLVVDVGNIVSLANKNIKVIPVKFGEADWMFHVNDNPDLNSLIGCPDSAIGLYCSSTGIKNFNGLGSVKTTVASNIKSLESFEGLPNEFGYLDIGGSCDGVKSLDNFPKIINVRLEIGPDFKWVGSLYKHMEMCGGITLSGYIDEYKNILKLLYVKGINDILSNTVAGRTVTNILNAEIQRQPDPRKRNLLKVSQELSNAGFHYLTVM